MSSRIVCVGLMAAFALCPPSLFAQKTGDTVVVTAPSEANLMDGDNFVTTVPRGNHLLIDDVNGPWYWVEWNHKKGWINGRDVVPFDKALDYFTDAIRRRPTSADYNSRGMIWVDKGEYDIALGDYNEAIRLDPKDAIVYSNRGNAWRKKGEYDKAFADYNEAIRLDPQDPDAYNNRGLAWKAKGDYDNAISDYNEALRLDPKYAPAYNNRGQAWQNKGNYDKALADYEAILRLDPLDVTAHNKLAWLLATCVDEKYRDGKKAVEYATSACELTDWKNANNIDTLAAAYPRRVTSRTPSSGRPKPWNSPRKQTRTISVRG